MPGDKDDTYVIYSEGVPGRQASESAVCMSAESQQKAYLTYEHDDYTLIPQSLSTRRTAST